MFCKNCGKEIKDDSTFCPYCGAPTSKAGNGGQNTNQNANRMYTSNSAPGPRPNPQAQPNVAYTYNAQPQWNENNIPPEYKPISMWGYFGYEILFSIPIVGFILLIVMCFAPSNRNVKNFARSYFCFLIIVLIVLLIITAVTGASLLTILS